MGQSAGTKERQDAEVAAGERFEFGKNRRGMSMWRDVIDWVGGNPFELAKPGEIFDFYGTGGFMPIRLRTCRGTPGCNQFVFRKTEQAR